MKAFDITFDQFMANSVGAGFNSGFATEGNTKLKEVRRVLKNMPEEFTAKDVQNFKKMKNLENAEKFLKTMRRMQMVKRLSPNSSVHKVADLYKKRL